MLKVSQKVDTAQVNGDTRANQSATTNNTQPVAKSTSTTAPKTNTNVTNAGYSLKLMMKMIIQKIKLIQN